MSEPADRDARDAREDRLIVQAPMAGGPSTPALAAAVSNAGGLGFLAAGYIDPSSLRAEIESTRTLTAQPFGVNLFAPSFAPAPRGVVQDYADLIAPLAAEVGVSLGDPRFDDDRFDEKLAVVLDMRPRVVSFTFGCPDPGTVRELQARGVDVWITVTSAAEARTAAQSGADALVVQGAEAGGHQGSFTDSDTDPRPLLDVLGEVRAALRVLPARQAGCRVVAAGGIHTGEHIARALEAGAHAVQLGTAFLLCPEAGTNEVHRNALRSPGATTLTRAFTGRRARGIVNAWTTSVGDAAPIAYPEVHHLTAPLRAHGRRVGNADLVNLWAGVNHHLAREQPAGDLVGRLLTEVAAQALGG